MVSGSLFFFLSSSTTTTQLSSLVSFSCPTVDPIFWFIGSQVAFNHNCVNSSLFWVIQFLELSQHAGLTLDRQS
eukprot:g58023.t1